LRRKNNIEVERGDRCAFEDGCYAADHDELDPMADQHPELLEIPIG
jgi:hypothetical protein